MKQRSVLNDRVFRIRSHADGRSIDQKTAAGQRLAKRSLIVVVIDGGAAARCAVDGIGKFQSSPVKTAGRADKNVDMPDPVQSRLGADCSGSAAASHHGDLLSGDIIACVTHRLHIADPVGGSAGEDAVVIDYRIDRFTDLGNRRDMIDQFHDLIFVRHGQVKSADPHSFQPLHRLRQRLFRHIETEVSIVQPKILKGTVMHQRRDTVRDRTSQKSGQFCCTRDWNCRYIHKTILLYVKT